MGLQAACVRWLKGRTNLEKVLMPISITLLFASILLIVVGFGYKRNSKEDGQKAFCLSAECYQTTGEILSMQDPSVDPCTDFYDYACGKFVATHSVPLDHYEASVEKFSSDSVLFHLKHWLKSPPDRNDNLSVFKKAKDLYSACMDYGFQENETKSVILRLIKEEVNGGWPALEAAWESPSWSMEKFLSSLTSLGVAVTFQLDILPDSSESNKYIVRISPGSPFLLQHQKHELLGDRILRSYLVSALILLGMNPGTVNNLVENMLEVDYHFFLIKEHVDKECGQPDERDDRGIRRVKLTELDNLMKTELSWTALLEDVLGAVDKSAVSAVDVYCQHYIREYVQLLYGNIFNKGQIYNYLSTRFFLTFISHLSPSFHGLHRNYISHPSALTLRPFQARWKECVFLLERYMLPVIATAYAQGVSEEIQIEGQRILVSLKSSFQNMLPSISWIEENEREWIKQKVSEVNFEIALMEYSQNIGELDKLFAGLQIDRNCLICSIVKLQKFVVSNRLQKLVSPDKPDVEWQNMTFTSPEHYQHYEGFLKIHFDKLIPPFLRIHQPNSLNYGNFGFFLSRELVHYAFNSGQISDRMRTCLSDQYSRYKIEEAGLKVNGSRTADENLVDNLSLLIAYDAYERKNKAGDDKKLPGLHLSDKENFFLSFAQAFCEVRDVGGYTAYVNSTFAPSKIRVNEVLKNSKKFNEAYTCAVGSPMNPPGKCHF